MLVKTTYICEVCRKEFADPNQARKCEWKHKEMRGDVRSRNDNDNEDI